MLRKIMFLLALMTAFVLAANEKIVMHDDFLPGLQRGPWLSVENPTEDWKQETPIRFSHENLRFRFMSGSQLLKTLELIDTGSGKVVWSMDKFTRPSVGTPKLAAGEYTIRCTGIPGQQKFSMAVNFYQNGWSMPSWRLNNATAEFPSGGGMLLTPEDDKKSGGFNGRVLGLTPGKYYEAEMVVKSSEAMELFMRYLQRINKEKKFGDAKFKTGVDQEQNWKVHFPALASSIELSINFPGKCFFKSITIREAEPPAETKKIGDRTMYFEPRNSIADPANPNLTTPVAYHRNLRMTYRDSVPQPFELIDKLETFTTLDNYAVWNFAIHNPGNERELELLQLSELRCGDKVIPADSIKISYVKFWDFPRNPYNYFNIPELILPQEKCVLPAGGNRIFWLQTRLKEDCAPGLYSGTATVKCGEKEITLPLQLKVLPFKLMEPPEMVWSIYSRLHVAPQKNYSMELTVRYLEDIKNYGITSLHNIGGSENSIKHIQEARHRAGMNGPLIVYNIWAERQALKRCGLAPDKKWFENPKVRDEFVAVLKEVDSWVKKYGGPGYDQWYYMGIDEPHVNNAMEAAAWQNKLAQQAGIQTMTTVYAPRYVVELAPNMNISANSFIGNNAVTNRELREIAEKYKNGYWYLGAGCYGGQEGGMMPNRLLSGFMSFKLGVTGHLIYTYQAYGKDPYDNFTRGKSYAVTYPDPKPSIDNMSVFTIEWEGIREGITDYKYLYTLKNMIDNARAKGKIAEADAGQAVLDRIIGFVPWRDDHKPGNGIMEDYVFDNAKADSLRAMAADAILKLKEIL